MEERTIKERAAAHGEATVANDMRKAGDDLTTDAMKQAPDVMKAMPGELSGCEVTKVEADGDDYVATIRYTGDAGSTDVASRWSEVDGEPKITNLEVL